MICVRPKQIGPAQNNWYSTKMIQNHFGPIEGQDITVLLSNLYTLYVPVLMRPL